MKLSIELLDLLLFLSIFIPYYLFIHAGKKTAKKKLETCKGIAKNHGLSPNLQEQWGNQFIGIDSLENSLLFIRLSDKETNTRIICLDKVRESQLVTNYQRIKKGNKKEEVLVYLALELILSGPGRPTELLTFYQAGENYEQDFEMARGEKWLGFVKDHFMPKKSSRVAA